MARALHILHEINEGTFGLACFDSSNTVTALAEVADIYPSQPGEPPYTRIRVLDTTTEQSPPELVGEHRITPPLDEGQKFLREQAALAAANGWLAVRDTIKPPSET